MVGNSQRLLVASMIIAIGPLLVPVQVGAAEDHVVKSVELHNAIVAASEARQNDIAKIRTFLSSDAGKKALNLVKIDSRKIENAVALLNDEELARLAARAEKIQDDFSAGALSNQELTYIVIALATAVIILVIVVA
jgi:hypothetical protein